MDIPRLKERMKKIAGELGLPFGDRKNTYNSRLAQELGKWAESEKKGEEFHNAVFRTYFVHGKNIGKTQTLVDVSESVGLSGEMAEKIILNRDFKDAVDHDWTRSQKMGVTGVPFLVMDGISLSGAQPYDVLEQFMRHNNVKKR